MLGLFGTLNLGARSLATQQQGVAVAGQNLANANNTAYARQRLVIQTSISIPTSIGMQGTGAEATAITQVRDSLLDQQITNETSLGGFLQAQQTALQYVQNNLGEQLGSATASTDGTGGVSSQGGLASDLTGLFNAFQALSTNPTSTTSRQAVLTAAQQLATQFNQVSQGLSSINDQLNQSVQNDASSANQLLSDIAGLNNQIASAQASGGTANDLLDLRQQKLESLAKVVNFQPAPAANGMVNITIGGQLMVSGGNVQDTLQTYDAGGGQLLLRTATSGTPLDITGGSIGGTINARDGALQDLRTGLDNVAGQLITQVNQVYSSGYDLHNNTGGAFFTGTNAGNIAVDANLAKDPSLLQAGGTAGATGDNAVALALAQLGTKPVAALNNQSIGDGYNSTVVALGSSLSTVNSQLSDQQTVQNMLQSQRASTSGVSLDEEMANLLSFERAFQASAHLVSTVDQMITAVINMKQ